MSWRPAAEPFMDSETRAHIKDEAISIWLKANIDPCLNA